MPSFTRRKFTITETLDDVLVELADQHYQGNVSLCLRAAIEDHRGTLRGGERESLIANRLSAQLESLASRQNELATAIESESSPQIGEGRLCDGDRLAEASEMTDPMYRVYEVLAEEGESLRFSDVTERVEASTADVQRALGLLLDRGIVTSSEGNQRRFSLAGQVRKPESER
jgi:hypothetical protein